MNRLIFALVYMFSCCTAISQKPALKYSDSHKNYPESWSNKHLVTIGNIFCIPYMVHDNAPKLFVQNVENERKWKKNMEGAQVLGCYF